MKTWIMGMSRLTLNLEVNQLSLITIQILKIILSWLSKNTTEVLKFKIL